MDTSHNVEALVVMQPIAVDTASPDRNGMLVMANGMLIAVLVRLEAPDHEQPDGWFLEATFVNLDRRSAPVFDSLDEATRWFRMKRRPQLA